MKQIFFNILDSNTEIFGEISQKIKKLTIAILVETELCQSKKGLKMLRQHLLLTTEIKTKIVKL